MTIINSEKRNKTKDLVDPECVFKELTTAAPQTTSLEDSLSLRVSWGAYLKMRRTQRV